MSGQITQAQLEQIIKRLNQDRLNAPGPHLPEIEFERRAKRIKDEVEKEMAGEPFYKRYLELHRRLDALKQNPLKPAGDSRTNVSNSQED